MFQRTKLHGGLMVACKICSPDYKKKKRRGVDEPKRERVTTLEGYLKRVIAEEIGEEELTKDFRFQVMQKFGTIAPRIDRRVTKPSWMSVAEWNRKRQEFHTQTVGLIPPQQYGRNNESSRTVGGTIRKTGSVAPRRKFQKPQHNVGV